MEKKCEYYVDAGASRIRGLHDSRPCNRMAKYIVRYKGGKTECVCGIHAIVIRRWGCNVEEIIPIDKINRK